MNRTPCAVAAIVASFAAFAGPARADADARALVAGCRACHAAGAVTAIPALDGRARAVLADRLRGFRDGSLTGTVMPQLAKGYTDEEIESIVAYLARPVRR